jgi:hypothetical protein
VAIVQISRITQRKGLAINLPEPLAGAELGWSTDTRQLFIGNGTLADGAPAEGNTEILTEFSDILNIGATYTYTGLAATGYSVQTGPTAGSEVALSLQNWMDQWCSVKDFGATGDGLTDDTEAINRALNQIYCVQDNTQVRRAIFFPAGVYRVTKTILIPTYATLYGDGPNSSIIFLATDNPLNPINDTDYPFVARTSDNRQQIGANIGNNGAVPPTDITISNMSFENASTGPTGGNVFYVQNATNCTFTNCIFMGAGTMSTLTAATNNTSGVSFASTNAQPTSNIVFDKCEFTGTVYGVYNSATTGGIIVSNSNFNTLYQGVVLNSSTSTGTRITQNIFDVVYAEGIVFGGGSNLNASADNIFYRVGVQFGTISTPPSTPVISITSNNNISIGDMFARLSSTLIPFVDTGTTNCISTANGNELSLGTYTTLSGISTTISNANGVVFSNFDTSRHRGFNINYGYTLNNGTATRTGTLIAAFTPAAANAPGMIDTFVQTANLSGNIINFVVTQSNSIASLSFTGANANASGTLSYSISYFK